MLHCSIHNKETYDSNAESLPYLLELLASTFNPDTPGDEEEVWGQEDADR